MAKGLDDGVAVGGLAVDQHFLAVVRDNALAFHRLAPALGFDGEDAFGADQEVVDVEGLVASLDRDVVDHAVALGAELFQELANGLFGGDSAVDEADLPDDLLAFPVGKDADGDRYNRECTGAERQPTQLNGPQIAAYDNGHNRDRYIRRDLLVEQIGFLFKERIAGVVERGLFERTSSGFHGGSMLDVGSGGNQEGAWADLCRWGGRFCGAAVGGGIQE